MPTFKATDDEIQEFVKRYGNGLQVRIDPPHDVNPPHIRTANLPPLGSGVYLGIDPGSSGGLAVIRGNKLTCTAMPETERDLWDWIKDSGAGFAIIEKVGGFMGKEKGDTGEQRNRASAHTMFAFGKGVGHLEMSLIGLGIPFESVAPVKWQSFYSMKRKSGESKPEWKSRLKSVAQKLFPSVKVTNATADAILLAEYCRRTRR